MAVEAMLGKWYLAGAMKIRAWWANLALLCAACGGVAEQDTTHGATSTTATGSGATGAGGSTSAGSGSTSSSATSGTTTGGTTTSAATSGAGGGPASDGGAIDASGPGGAGGGSVGDGGTPSSGCNHPWMPSDVTLEPARAGRSPAMQVVRRTIDVGGITREYLVAVPQGYDPSKTHALVFGFHGSGGDREQLRRYMNVELPANGEAVFIYPSGLPQRDGGVAEWDLSQDSPDLVLVDKLLEQYTGELCIDRQRVYATGHSFGGCMSNAIGCFRGGTLRAIAPVAGCGPSRNAQCVGKVAVMQIHSPKDTQVAYGTAIRLCTKWMRANTCDEMPACGCNWTDQLTMPSDQCVQMAQEPYVTAVPIDVTAQDEQPPVLRQYLNCDPGYPLVFIDHWHREKTTVGDPAERWHNPPPWSAAVIWEFLKRLN
jgi:polyhydroxybutyrate depolymerase